jgi:hypothetical protein
VNSHFQLAAEIAHNFGADQTGGTGNRQVNIVRLLDHTSKEHPTRASRNHRLRAADAASSTPFTRRIARPNKIAEITPNIQTLFRSLPAGLTTRSSSAGNCISASGLPKSELYFCDGSRCSSLWRRVANLVALVNIILRSRPVAEFRDVPYVSDSMGCQLGNMVQPTGSAIGPPVGETSVIVVRFHSARQKC